MVWREHGTLKQHLCGLNGGLDDLLGKLLVHFPDLEGDDSLEETRAVEGAGGALVLEELLGDLARVLSSGSTHTLLDVAYFIQVAELAVHLYYGHLLVVPVVGAGGKLDAW